MPKTSTRLDLRFEPRAATSPTAPRWIVKDSLVDVYGSNRVADVPLAALFVASSSSPSKPSTVQGNDSPKSPSRRPKSPSLRDLGLRQQSRFALHEDGIDDPSVALLLDADAEPQHLALHNKQSYTDLSLPPFAKIPLLPPALKIKSVHYSLPSQSLQLNPHTLHLLAETPWGQTESSNRIMNNAADWARRQRKLHLKRSKKSPGNPRSPQSHLSPNVAALAARNREDDEDENNEEAEEAAKAFIIPEYVLRDTLQRLDLLITVAHCGGCSGHTTLRHKASAYCEKASAMLARLAKAVEDFGPEARVGVVRLRRCPPAPVTLVGQKKLLEKGEQQSISPLDSLLRKIASDSPAIDTRRIRSAKRTGALSTTSTDAAATTTTATTTATATATATSAKDTESSGVSQSQSEKPSPIRRRSSLNFLPSAIVPFSPCRRTDTFNAITNALNEAKASAGTETKATAGVGAGAVIDLGGPSVRQTIKSETMRRSSMFKLFESVAREQRDRELTPQPKSGSDNQEADREDTEDTEEEEEEEEEESALQGARVKGQLLYSQSFRRRIPLGAFEVQASFMTREGQVVTKILFSKLARRAWPSVPRERTTEKTTAGSDDDEEEEAVAGSGVVRDAVTEKLLHFLCSHVSSLASYSLAPSKRAESKDDTTSISSVVAASEEGGNVASVEEKGKEVESTPEEPPQIDSGTHPQPAETTPSSSAYCAYPDTCTRGCRRKDQNSIAGFDALFVQTSAAPGKSRKSSTTVRKPSVGTRLMWLSDTTETALTHQFAVGDVVDVVQIEPLLLSPRRGRKRQSEDSCVPTVNFSHFSLENRQEGTVVTVRPLSHSRSSSPQRPRSPFRASPTKPQRSGLVRTDWKHQLWYSQGCLRGSVTSAHWDGTYDVSYWPSNEVGGERRSRLPHTSLCYIPQLDSIMTSLGKRAVAGFVEVGVTPEWLRPLRGDQSVLVQMSVVADDEASVTSDGSVPSVTQYHFSLTERTLHLARRPWKPVRDEETAPGETKDNTKAQDFRSFQEEGENENEIEFLGAGEEVSPTLEASAYFPLLL